MSSADDKCVCGRPRSTHTTGRSTDGYHFDGHAFQSKTAATCIWTKPALDSQWIMRVTLCHQNGTREALYVDVPGDMDPEHVSLDGTIDMRTDVFENVNPANIALVYRVVGKWKVYIVSASIEQNIKNAWKASKLKFV